MITDGTPLADIDGDEIGGGEEGEGWDVDDDELDLPADLVCTVLATDADICSRFQPFYSAILFVLQAR